MTAPATRADRQTVARIVFYEPFVREVTAWIETGEWGEVTFVEAAVQADETMRALATARAEGAAEEREAIEKIVRARAYSSWDDDQPAPQVLDDLCNVIAKRGDARKGER